MMMRLGDMETDFEKEIKDAFKFFDKNSDGVVRGILVRLFSCVVFPVRCFVCAPHYFGVN